MDLEVKREVVEEQQLNAASLRENSREPRRVEDEATLAQLSLSTSTKPKRKPKPKKIFTADEPIKSTKKKEKIILKIKKTQSEPTIKQAVTESGGKCKRKNKDPVDGPCPHAEVKSAAMIRAEEVQSNLEPQYPSFAKSMVRSHVASCFWMGLPGQFCKLHLPTKDASVVLEDECGKLYEAKYFAEKTGLSAGWRQFSTGHNLLEGDVLVFQLIDALKFKVYIIRANDFSEVDGALGLLNLDAHTKQNDADLNFEKSNSEMNIVPHQNTKRKRLKSLPLAVVQKKNKKSGQSKSASNIGQPAEQSENDSEEVGSEVLEGFKLSAPAVQFKDVTSLDSFNIFVDGSILDSELPEDIRCKYYELCCTRNAFLHDSLIQGINFKLIGGIIAETVNIADAVRACNLGTSRDEFANWEKTLKAFELLGMNVGFLRARIRRLLNFAFESEGATDTRRYIEAKAQRATAEDEIRNIEARLAELKGACVNFCAEIDSLKSKAEIYELKFQEEVNAPW
ncbi:B3 domain-containing protein Os01g0234100-like isoform X2 [Pistacia vera]|uniref:B3 domain-containing protein Os01g0234100-like isoform X2 n=1 Tax=Pistacia vera TaxID=55513 RepID=UPI001263581D|nr:B3 domain-containing protein Os01g0234100-like isoform X2 [Pistacia vera]